jgi:hypothetical protein
MARDGNWWITQGKLNKLDYVTGFSDGMQLGSEFSTWAMPKDDPAVHKALESYDRFSTKYTRNVSVGQIPDGLDQFYSDYRNRRIVVTHGIWLVLNEISGKPEADMQKMIESWRRNAVPPAQ